ncbi:MAG: multiple sugar transport system permease protein, partial [Gaiellales bacterium]|nr:multiple sugar transport system permease protein [Gaiellales bacterium]
PRRGSRKLPFGYVLIIPIVIYEGIFLLYPMYEGLVLSLEEKGGSHGLSNFDRLIHDELFWDTVKVTLEYTAFVVVLSLLIGLGTALLMNAAFKGRGVMRAVLTTPWAFPDVPTTIAFLWMLNPTFGVANVFARWLPWVHENPQWLNSEKLALGCVIVITVWKGFPFYGLVILAALQTVPGSLYEAARVDGATPWGRFRYVTIPAILPTLSLLAILSSIFAIQQFTLIYLTTGGGPVTATNTLAIDIYQQAFRFYDFSYASTVAAAGLLTSALAVILFIFIEKKAGVGELA